MPRNMSFMLTSDQIRNRTKTVTRRLGWKFLKKGDLLNACVKCQGLGKGGKIERICQIRVVDVRREPLDDMDHSGYLSYGNAEAEKEGFGLMTGSEFVTMFCENMGCESSDEVTRIEFEYVDQPPVIHTGPDSKGRKREGHT